MLPVVMFPVVTVAVVIFPVVIEMVEAEKEPVPSLATIVDGVLADAVVIA
jgi:hypothetical protein